MLTCTKTRVKYYRTAQNRGILFYTHYQNLIALELNKSGIFFPWVISFDKRKAGWCSSPAVDEHEVRYVLDTVPEHHRSKAEARRIHTNTTGVNLESPVQLMCMVLDCKKSQCARGEHANSTQPQHNAKPEKLLFEAQPRSDWHGGKTVIWLWI